MAGREGHPMTALTTLAARVEAASGADRDLDAEIARAAGWDTVDGEQWWSPADAAERRRLKVSRWRHQPVPLPAFTASLDAAMTLVPEGWRKMVDDLDRTPEAIVSTPEQRRSWDAAAATLPLALCAAALRALAAQGS